MSDDVRIQILAEKSAAATAALRSTKEELRGIRQEATAGGQAFQRIRRDVAQAALDYKRGAISARDYQEALRFAREETQRLGLDANRLNRDIARLNTTMLAVNRPTRITAAQFKAAEARIAATAVATVKVGEASKVARQGLGTVRSTLGSLSAMAIGTKGTLGTLGSALLQFGAGNMVAIGVLGGLAAMAGAYRLLGRSAREAREEAKKLADELARSREARLVSPLEARRRQLAGIEEAISAEEARGKVTVIVPELEPTAAAAQRRGRVAEGAAEKLNDLYAQRRELLALIREEEAKIEGERQHDRTAEIAALVHAHDLGNLNLEGRRRALQLEKDINAELRNANLDLAERNRLTEESRRLAELVRIEVAPLAVAIPRATDQRFPAAGVAGARQGLDFRRRMGALTAGMERLVEPVAPGLADTAQGAKELARALQQVEMYLRPVVSQEELYAQKLSMLRMVMDEMELTVEQRTEAERLLREAMVESKVATQQWATAAILATGQLAAMAIRGGGGGVGGFIGGLLGLGGGIVSMFNPLIGAGLMATGGIITAASQRGEPTRVSIANYEPTALQQQKQVIMPSRFTFQFYGPRGELTQEEILYTTRHLEDIDAVVRIPGTRLGGP